MQVADVNNHVDGDQKNGNGCDFVYSGNENFPRLSLIYEVNIGKAIQSTLGTERVV